MLSPLTATGRPISQALDTADAPLILSSILVSLDRVHGDGELPRIPVRADNAIDGSALYRVSAETGEPVGILVRTNRGRPGLFFLHEIGHFLDHRSIGRRGVFASVDSQELADWRDAVDASRTVDTLRTLIVQDGGIERELPVVPGFFSYVLQRQEIWARSYAQYIVQATGLPALVAQLASALGAGHQPVPPYTLQWESVDFAPISAAIDRLFRAKGWKQR